MYRAFLYPHKCYEYDKNDVVNLGGKDLAVLTGSQVEFVSFDELLERSDIVSVHCPLNSESENMFDKTAFSKMKNGAVFVNTARGGVMVENDLYNALQNDVIGGAAIDTLVVEPMEEDCILMQAKNCIITPHIAWAPVETRERLMGIVAENIRLFLNGTPQNVVC